MHLGVHFEVILGFIFGHVHIILGPKNGMWGHFGHVDVILDATWGPRGAIRLNLGVILGSNWAQFWVQNDIKIHDKKTMIFG